MKLPRIPLLSLSVLSVFTLSVGAGCSSDKEPGPTTTGDGRVTINSDGDDLSDNVQTRDEPVDVQPDGTPNGLVFVPDPVYTLTLVAEVSPPRIDGEELQATAVSFDGERAAVSYNSAGSARMGAIDIFVFDQNRRPRLTSRATFDDTDVNAVTAAGGRVWLATATADESFGTPAVLEGLSVLQNGALTLTDHVRVGLSSHAANSVAVAEGRVFATSGSAGGVFAFDPGAGQIVASTELTQARWVAAPGDGTLIAVRGMPGRLARLAANDLSPIGEIPFEGAQVAEAKSTVQVLGDKAFVAGGPGGAVVVDIASGQTLAQIPVPTGLWQFAQSEVVTNAVSVDGELLFISNGAAGCYLVIADGSLADAYDPSVGMPKLTQAGRLVFPGEIASVNHIAYKDGFLFVATGRGGLKIVRAERIVPVVEPPIGYPYVTDFTDEDPHVQSEREGWTLTGSWGFGAPDGARQGVAGAFLDNDPNLVGAASEASDALLDVPLVIPGSGAPAIAFSYGASFVGAEDRVELQVSDSGGPWVTLATFGKENERAGLARRIVALDAYRGKTIKVRFHQVMGPQAGVRRFVVDDLAIAELDLPALDFPYVASFEDGLERSPWNLEGAWSWAQGDALEIAGPSLAGYDDGQFAELMGFVPIPATGHPVISFSYRSDLFEAGDTVVLEIQRQGEGTWTPLAPFTQHRDSASWAYHESSLIDYRGESVRVRLAVSFGAASGARSFVADDFEIGQLAIGSLPYPYGNGFEGVAASEWVSEGLLDVAALAQGGSGIVSDPDAGAGAWGEVRSAGFVTVPVDGPVLISFRGQMQLQDGDTVAVLAQTDDDPAWLPVAAFDAAHTHPAWTRYEASLDHLLGRNVRLRIRVDFGSGAGTRALAFDDVAIEGLPAARFDYPYDAALDASSLTSWVVNGSWTPVDGFVDANPLDEVQAGWGAGQQVAMPGFVAVPEAGRPTLFVSLDLGFADPSDTLVLEIQTADDASWTALRTYTFQHNRDGFGWDELPLDDYRGEEVRVRLRYGFGSASAARRVCLGGLRFEDLALPGTAYPWFNGFESEADRAQWSLWGGWDGSGAHGASQPASGASFLDGNPSELVQSGWSELQTATWDSSVTLPGDLTAFLGFSHRFQAAHPDDRLDVEVQGADELAWTTIATLGPEHVRSGYGKLELPLDAWNGRAIRLRFAMHLGASGAVRAIGVDDVWVGPLELPAKSAPFTSDFSQAGSANDWALNGLWGTAGGALHANPAQVDNGGHATFQTARLVGFVGLANVMNPELRVSYTLDLRDAADRAYIEVLQRGSTNWIELATFKPAQNTAVPAEASWSLMGFDEVTVRLRVVSAETSGSRDFAVRSITVGAER